MRITPFHQILGNNLVANITNFTVWFALTFWVFIETRSVFATGMIAGIFLVFTAAFGFWLGSIVDNHPKLRAMTGSSIVSLAFYLVSAAMMLAAPEGAFTDPYGPYLWAFVLVVMLGVIAGNIRAIALPTLVTILIPEPERDKANGLVGMVSGIGFLTTSMISGLLVAWTGMFGTLVFAIGFSILAALHLMTVRIAERRVDPAEGETHEKRGVDIMGTIALIGSVPGLFALILFATFNNFLGGVFMALVDAYALSMVSVEVWGILLGVLSSAFIFSGVVISRVGLGRNPLRTLLLANMAAWTVSSVFAIQSSIWLLAVGFFVWMLLGPAAEAAEHTTLQKVVPVERQGRVFGFAQSLEQSASPLTAFMIGPLTEFVVIPFMTDGQGARTIGWWFGTGPDRGIGLVFTVAGLIGLVVTGLAFLSKPYRQLSAFYLGEAEAAERPAGPPATPA